MKNIFKHGGLVRFGYFEINPNITENGSIYYNNSSNLFKVYENGSWENLATRKYADSIAAGFDPKESVAAANLTTNTPLSGSAPLVLDGVTLAAGDRILLGSQTNSVLNGIYVYSESGANYTLIRSADFNDSIEVNGGEFVFVSGGTTWATTAWIVTSPGVISVDPLTFSQVQGQAKNLNQAYVVGNYITTTSLSGSVVIEGSQKLLITADNGLDVGSGLFTVSKQGEMSASAGLVTTESGHLSSVFLSVGSSNFTVNQYGNLTKIKGVPYNFPSAQASFSNAALTNDSSGNLSWNALTIKGLSDVALTGGSAQTGELLRFNGTHWVNESPVETTASNAVVKTNASGFIDETFLQYDINFGGDADLSGIRTLTAASGLLSSTADGNLALIRGVNYYFPTAQASEENSILVNDSSGHLTWAQNNLFSLSDVSLTSASAKDLLRYDGSSWINEKAISTHTSSGINKILMTNSSGFLDESFLKYNINFGNNILSGVADPINAQDISTKAYVDLKTANLTLQGIYEQDTDGSGAIITTNSVDGDLIIAGSEALLISATEGLKLASNGDVTKYTQMLYRDSILLSANTTSVVEDLSFNKTVHGGLQATYKIKDLSTNGVRVGYILVSTDGSEASLADTFTETQDLNVSWSASISGNDVEISYSAGAGNKIMNAKLDLLPA